VAEARHGVPRQVDCVQLNVRLYTHIAPNTTSEIGSRSAPQYPTLAPHVRLDEGVQHRRCSALYAPTHTVHQTLWQLQVAAARHSVEPQIDCVQLDVRL
jgi:hypothetical protein